MSEETLFASRDGLTAKSVVEMSSGSPTIITDIFMFPPCGEAPLQHIRFMGPEKARELAAMLNAAIATFEKMEAKRIEDGLPF